MRDEQPTIPDGYKQTEVGVIPEDWEVKKLFEVANFENGKAHEDFINDLGKYIVVNSKFISSDGEIYKYSKVNLCPLRIGDIALVMSDIPNGKALAKCYLVKQDKVFALNQRICSIRATTANNEFLFRLLNRNKYFLEFDSGTGQTNLRKDEVLHCPLALPPTKEEQQAIAEVLSDVDALITSLDQLITKKRNIKQGAMQLLLTGKKRLAGFSGDWETKTLGEIGAFKKGKGINKDSVLSHGLPCIRYGEIYTRHNEYIKKFYSFINIETAKQSQRIKTGDLLFAGSGETAEEIGKCVAYLNDIEAYAGGDIIVLSPIGYDSQYLGFLMNQQTVVTQKSQMAQGDAVVHIYANSLAKIAISVPPTIEEQKAIAQILSDMDAEIEALEKKREKYKAIKQGMMQELLTGKTRLI